MCSGPSALFSSIISATLRTWAAQQSVPFAYLGIAIEASSQVIIADDRVDAIVRVDALGNGDHAVISK